MKNKLFRKMFPFRVISFFYLLFFIFVPLTLIHCKRKGEKKFSYDTNQVYPVSLVQTTSENVPEDLELKGNFVPSEKLEVRAEVDSKVLQVKVKEGDLINQNDLLATLDSEKLKLLLEKLKFELKETEAKLEAGLPLTSPDDSSKPDPNVQKQATVNVNNLSVQPDSKANRQNTAEEAKQENQNPETAPADKKREIQDPTLRAEQATVDRLKAEVNLLQKKLETVEVHSGISGLLTKKEISEGSFVKSGETLFQIVRIDPINFVIYLPRAAVMNIQKGSRFEVYSDDLPGQTLVGEVIAIAPEETAQNKGYEVKASIPNIMLKLRGGMSGKIKIPHFQFKKVVVVPEVAIIERDQKKYVYVVDQYQAEIREVELGRKFGDKIEVTKGLKEGESVVSKGHFTFRQDREKVKVE